MTIRELYKAIGGDYEDIRRRMPSDSMIEQFLLRFPADTSYAAMQNARKRHNPEGAFLAAHTLKGVAAALGLKELTVAVSLLADALRPPSPLPDNAFFDAVAAAYDRVIRHIAAFPR